MPRLTSRVRTDMMRRYNIKGTTLDPYYPEQDSVVRGIQDVKTTAEIMTDRTGADPKTWLKALEYTAYIHKPLARNDKDFMLFGYRVICWKL